MNVTFHTLSALATSAALSSKRRTDVSQRVQVSDGFVICVAGFCCGILVHGLLDYLPHSYPIRSSVDVIFSLALFIATVAFAKGHRLLVGSCFLGSICPDLLDLGPAILNHQFGWALPVVKIFPWHWQQYSGSIYDGRRALTSFFWHFVVVSVSLKLLWTFRTDLFASERYHATV